MDKEIDWSEHYIQKKEEGGKPTYYIIRRADNTVGLFSNYLVFAGHIRYALSNGYIPVIDMKNYSNTLLGRNCSVKKIRGNIILVSLSVSAWKRLTTAITLF